MSTTRSYAALLPLFGVIAAIAIALPAPAVADENPCSYGYTPRGARPGDMVCVTSEVKGRTQQENANPALHRSPNGGAYGPDTCLDGYVWREAFDGDTICVSPEERAATLADNAAGASHLQANTTTTEIKTEVYGSGGVTKIDVNGQLRAINPNLPWADSYFVGPDVKTMEMTVFGTEYATAGCRIIVGGNVLVEQPVINGTAHCVFSRG